MANQLQIKRSALTAAPGSLVAGELAYSNTTQVLYIGSTDGGTVVPIGGFRAPGTLTANQALVANSTSGINRVWAANLQVSYIEANGAGNTGTAGYVMLSGGSGSSVYWSPTVNATSFTTGNTTIGTGGVSVNTTAVEVGNNTVNTMMTNAGYTLNGTVFIANTTGMYHTGAANAASFTAGLIGTGTGGFNANATVMTVGNNTINTNITSASYTLNGTTFIANTTGIYHTGTVNAASYSIGTTWIANSTGMYHTGTINAASLTIGGTTTANSSGLYQTTLTSLANTTLTGTYANVQATTTTIAGTTTTISSNVVFTGATVNATSSTFNVRDAVISGNLTINGTLTTIDSQNLVVKDPTIKLADNNTSTDLIDIGVYGVAGNTTSTYYSGFYRDHAGSLTNPLFKLFSSTTEPTTTVDNTAIGYAIGTLHAYHITPGGSFTANSTVVNITANSTVSVALVANTLSLSTALPATSGGTGQATYTSGDILVANTGNALNKLSLGTSGYVLQSNGSALVYGVLDGGTF